MQTAEETRIREEIAKARDAIREAEATIHEQGQIIERLTLELARLG